MKNQEYIDVSFDFDFFFWDDPNWDWVHQETMFFLELMWAIREQGLSIYGKSLDTESTLDRADFHPTKLIEVLDSKGLQVGKWTKVYISESHVEQYGLSLRSKRSLVMFDAHSDIWRGGEIDCGSWLWFLLNGKHLDHATVVLPSWQDWYRVVPESEYIKLADKVSIVKWDDYSGSGQTRVNNLFICRSGCWVPPHHDRLFGEMVAKLMGRVSKFYRRGTVDPLCPRNIDYKKVRCSSDQSAFLRKNYFSEQ